MKAMMQMLGRWLQFLRERHEPLSLSMMVLAFFAANVGIAWLPSSESVIPWGRLGAGYVLIWLCFLHMRLFDEVKDYAVDREFHPERPLARGLIGLPEFGTATLLCLLSELAIAANLGWGVFSAYVCFLAFTLLMRMEFFVGDWLRPRLELYAITHTFSAALLGVQIQAVATGQPPVLAEGSFLIFALGNWFVFNVFEFGRKTLGREEERDGVDSYSARLRPVGAVGLLSVNLALALGALWLTASIKFSQNAFQLFVPAGAISVLVVLAGIYYIFSPDKKGARIYRGTVTFYLLAYHVAVFGGCYSTLPR